MEVLKDFYTVLEVAKLLGINAQSVRKRIKSGTIKATKLNGAYLISKEEVERVVDKKGA